MSGLALTFIGSGDAFSSGGRLQSGILLSAADKGLLLDCGSTLLAGLQRASLGTDAIDAVAVSHLHGDHFGGIPFLLLDALFVSKRHKPLLIIGPAGIETRVTELCALLYPGTFDAPLPFALHFLEVDAGQQVDQDFFSLAVFSASHGQRSSASSLRVDLAGLRVAYSGDTEWTAQLPQSARGADLLICECCSYDEKLPGHLDYLTLKEHSSELGAKRIILTHTGPSIDANRQRIDWEIASDGLTLQL